MAYELTVVMRFDSEADVPWDREIEDAFDCVVVEHEVEEV